MPVSSSNSFWFFKITSTREPCVKVTSIFSPLKRFQWNAGLGASVGLAAGAGAWVGTGVAAGAHAFSRLAAAKPAPVSADVLINSRRVNFLLISLLLKDGRRMPPVRHSILANSRL